MSMNAMDLYAIQECLIGYRKLIEWLPVTNEFEGDMKDERIRTINHIIDITDNELERISKVFRDEDIRE